MKHSFLVSLAMVGLTLAVSQARGQVGLPPPGGGSVSIYGLLDTGLERLNNVGADRSTLNRMPGLTGSLPSRLGFRGREDLGGGLAAIFTLESGVGIDTGTFNQGGRTFGRQAWVGLAGNWGAVTLGRNYSMLYWSVFDGDQLGPNAFGIGSLDSYIPNTRVDNSVAYRGTFGGFTAGATYSLGRDAVNAGPSPSGSNCPGEGTPDVQACRQWSALLKYDSPVWGAAFGADEQHGGPGAFAGLVRSGLTDLRLTLNGYYRFTPALKIVGGILRRDNDGAAPLSAVNGASRRSDLYWVGGAWNLHELFLLDGQIHRLAFKDGGDKASLAVLRGTYSFSKRTTIYAQAGRIINGPRLSFSVSSAQAGGLPAAGVSQTGFMAGIRHIF